MSDATRPDTRHADIHEAPAAPMPHTPTAPPTVAGKLGTRDRPVEADTVSTIIPYRNPPALIAYYLGLFSLLPMIGLFLAIPAVILGIAGLRYRSRNPHVRGAAHAWIGIIMGGLLTLVWGGVFLLMLLGP